MSNIELNRRRFLQSLGALTAYGSLPLGFARHAHAQDSGSPATDRVLVVVHLDGGCDGINTVIPFADPAYAAARPTLAIASAEVLKLDTTDVSTPGHDRFAVPGIRRVMSPSSTVSAIPISINRISRPKTFTGRPRRKTRTNRPAGSAGAWRRCRP